MPCPLSCRWIPLVLLIALPWRAVAQPPPASTRLPPPPSMVRRAVNASLARRLGNGCSYQAHLEGTVLESRVGPRTTYVPDVHVRTVVSCPRARTQATRDRTVQTPQIDRAHLEEALESAASVLTAASGFRCDYTPSLQYREGRVLWQQVAWRCTLPRLAASAPRAR
jgi:hypothetical protein